MIDDAEYAPFYCEENVWRLCERLTEQAIPDVHAVFVANEDGSVAVWSQRASQHPEGLTVWDYHVVALARPEGAWHVFDLDCTAGSELPVEQWLAASFPLAGVIPPELEPTFRVVPAQQLFEQFRTDRSHMRAPDGSWLHEPPPWPALSDSSNLARYIDPLGIATGEVVGMREFAARS